MNPTKVVLDFLEAWPRGGRFRFHPVEFHFGKPIDPQAFGQAADPYSVISEKLRDEVTVLSGDRNEK